MAKKKPADEALKKSRYLSQQDVPSCSLSKALRIAQTIADNYAKAPTKPLRVAEAMQVQPASGPFRMLCGASIAYGLTDGGGFSDVISITPLGKRIVAPVKEGDDFAAKREAMLQPRVVREFLTKYNNSRLPSEMIAKNVLEEIGVPKDRTEQTLAFILEGARDVGFLRDVKGQPYVDLESTPLSSPPLSPEAPVAEVDDAIVDGRPPASNGTATVKSVTASSNRVFITHGKNKDIVTQLKELLTFGKFEPVVSVEHETVSKPVSDKVLDDMRSCYAGIIHVGTEMRLLDSDGKEHKILNPNVLIEIGAAMALYGRRFILLVEQGVSLPSNLQGLYEVRYTGDKLDYESTMKLLKAFNDFKN
jgi:predicted nucleotide-binding protein